MNNARYDDMRLLSKNAVHVLRDHVLHERWHIRCVDGFDQTRGEMIAHEILREYLESEQY